MESVMRILLAVLLTVSALSAAEFSVQRAFERVKVLAAENEAGAGAVAKSVSRAVTRPVADLALVGLELGAAASRMGLQIGCSAVAEAREGFWKAYGH